MRQLHALHVPMKTFNAKDESIDGAKALLREMGAFFHKENRAEELCAKIDRDMAAAAAEVKKYANTPRVAVIHFGRASNVYLVVGNGGRGDASTAGTMVRLAAANLVFRAGGRALIDGVTATFDPGRLHLIVGPNGAGKSTLVKLLARLISPSDGVVAYGGPTSPAGPSDNWRAAAPSSRKQSKSRSRSPSASW